MIQLIQQMRILQFITTALLRRNQTELVDYSAKYNLILDEEESSGDEMGESAFQNLKTDGRDFEFHAKKVRTVAQLTRGFEARTNLYDRLLLYFLTGKEN